MALLNKVALLIDTDHPVSGKNHRDLAKNHPVLGKNHPDLDHLALQLGNLLIPQTITNITNIKVDEVDIDTDQPDKISNLFLVSSFNCLKYISKLKKAFKSIF